MRVRLVRRPGQHGTRAYVNQYGNKLICVRYRYDEAAQRRYKTVEIIVEEGPWERKPETAQKPKRYAPHTLVGIRVRREERELQAGLKDAGATWQPRLNLWQLRYDQTVALGLTERIIGTIRRLLASL